MSPPVFKSDQFTNKLKELYFYHHQIIATIVSANPLGQPIDPHSIFTYSLL